MRPGQGGVVGVAILVTAAAGQRRQVPGAGFDDPAGGFLDPLRGGADLGIVFEGAVETGGEGVARQRRAVRGDRLDDQGQQREANPKLSAGVGQDEGVLEGSGWIGE